MRTRLFFLQVLMLFSRYVCERAQCQLPLVLIQCLRYLQWVRPIPCGIKWRHYHYCLYCQLCTSSSYGLDLFGTDTNNTIYPAEHKSNYVIRTPGTIARKFTSLIRWLQLHANGRIHSIWLQFGASQWTTLKFLASLQMFSRVWSGHG